MLQTMAATPLNMLFYFQWLASGWLRIAKRQICMGGNPFLSVAKPPLQDTVARFLKAGYNSRLSRIRLTFLRALARILTQF
ncbi:MAG: hypothetical protein JO269_02325 [Burkholderiaceae bacterium]|nr:hypothetical protein [Burkholderiaceae bacterium]